MKKFIEYSGYVVGLIGLILSIYFYEVSKKEKEPTFVLEPVRTEIINSEKLKNSPIRITKSDSQEIKNNLTSIRFYFWNKGKEAIKDKDILSDILISVDSGSKIIFSRILKQAREINHITLDQIDSNTLRLTFKILEIDDGFTGEFLVEGNGHSELTIQGAIEGVKSFSKFPASFYKVISKTFLYFILGVITLAFMVLFSGGGNHDPDYVVWKADKLYKENDDFKNSVDELEMKVSEMKSLRKKVREIKNPDKKEKTEEENSKSRKKFKNTLIAVGALIVVGVLIFIWYTVNEEIKENPLNFIPSSIKP